MIISMMIEINVNDINQMALKINESGVEKKARRRDYRNAGIA